MTNELEQMQAGESPEDPEACLDADRPTLLQIATSAALSTAVQMADELEVVAEEIEADRGDATRINSMIARFYASKRIIDREMRK